MLLIEKNIHEIMLWIVTKICYLFLIGVSLVHSVKFRMVFGQSGGNAHQRPVPSTKSHMISLVENFDILVPISREL